MSNPGGSVSINALSVAVPTGILLFVIIMLLFQFKAYMPFFTGVLWLGIPVIAFVLTAGMNFASQYMYCHHVDSARAFLGALPSLFAALIGLGVSSISFCRIPVVSVVAPFFPIEQPVNQKQGCCNPMPSLEAIETQFPIASGLSYGFYLFFSMLFGTLYGSGIAVVC